jgi:hypothetical protein
VPITSPAKSATSLGIRRDAAQGELAWGHERLLGLRARQVAEAAPWPKVRERSHLW